MFALFRNGAALDLVRGPIVTPSKDLSGVELAADRFTLAKRRWRGKAADGREFGFDLDCPLCHGDVFFQTDEHRYIISQTAEPVLRIALTSPEHGARIAWQVGNMHLPVALEEGFLLVEDDPIVRQMLERDGSTFTAMSAIFRPIGGVAGHHHSIL